MFWLYWKEFYSHLLDEEVESDESLTQEAEGEAPAFMDQSWCLWHPVEGCLHFSDNWQEVCGQTTNTCAEGGLFEKIHPDDHAPLFKHLEQLVRCEGSDHSTVLGTLECRIEQNDGEGYRWFECRFTFSQTQSHDEHPLIVFALRDIQRVVELKYQAAEATEQSAFAEKGRRDFLTHMSHELRTPLNAILGFSQMIQTEAYGSLGNPHYSEYIENIRNSGEELLNKINNLLELGTIDAQQNDLQDMPVNLQDIVGEITEMHSHHAFEKNIKLAIQSNLPQMVLRVDKVRLLHALANILDNAIDHAPEGSQVTIAAQNNRNGGLSIAFEDTGGGIAEGQLNSMIEALQTKRADHNPFEKNVGVGLLLAHRIAHVHGGELVLENTALGCRAVLTLPKERIVSQSARIKPKARRTVAS